MTAWNFLSIARRRLLPIALSLFTLVSVILFQAGSVPATSSASLPIETVEAIPTSTAAEPVPAPSPDGTSKPTETPKAEASDPAAEPELSPEALKRQKTFIEADQLYLGGQFAAAEKLYRQVKPPFANAVDKTDERPQPFSDPAQLSPGGKVYWREAQAGIAQKLETKILVPLRLLVEKQPEFIPGQIALAQALKQYKKPEEGLSILERASGDYPNEPELLKARVVALAEAKQWMEASIAARQFALMNPNHPQAPELLKLADDNLGRFQGDLNQRLTGNLIGNVLTGALGYALTGSLFGPFSAVQTTALLLQGESGVGASYASEVRQLLEMVDDPDLVGYVNELGKRMAIVAGRKDFQYEFYVVADKKLNAFALPGGKVFVNAGAIANLESEAQLAGLMGHELSHAVLSHAFQLVTQDGLIGNLTQFLPLGGIISNLAILSYSRDMEQQADMLGTRMLVSAGYAADGMRNLMLALEKEKTSVPVSWLSTHPVTGDRVGYLEEVIQRNGYNRYAYEGVARHSAMQAKAKKILAEKLDEKSDDRPL